MDEGNIYLVGMMGAGKTTVGRALARRLGRPFVDCDKEIVQRTGVPVATIFEIEGEAGFRRRESEALAQIAATPGQVVATGGGAVLAEVNRETLRRQGTVVYLRVSVDRLVERTARDTARPLLAGVDRRATIESLLALRDPLYREVAHFVIDSAGQSPGTLAGRIAEALHRPSNPSPRTLP